MKPACVMLLEEYADWESAFACAELRRTFGVEVKTATVSGVPVTSMGGFTVQPDMAVEDLVPEDFSMLILPGSDAWADNDQREVYTKILEFWQKDVSIAAICGATIALARLGLLKDKQHTSNGQEFLLQLAPNYIGRELYEQAPVIRDENIITASGLGAVSFAAEIFLFYAPEKAEDIAAYKKMMAGRRA